MSSSLSHRFAEFATAYELFDNGQLVLLSISGGCDSMALLGLMIRWQPRWKLTLGVAHFNHRLRGVESDLDQKLVADTAQKFGLPFYCGAADVKQATEKGASLEAVARKMREDFLTACAEKEGYSLIATAHHNDDQAETLMMRIIRGTGPGGLAGIRLRRQKFVRPLLFASRADILTYVKNNGIVYREDLSNQNQQHLRNRIRHSLMPMLKNEFDVKDMGPFFRLAMLMQDWEDKNESELKRALLEIRGDASENKIHLDISGFRQYFSGIQQKCLEAILNNLLQEDSRLNFQLFHSFKRWLKRCKNGSTFLFFNRVAVYQKGRDLIFSLQSQSPDKHFFVELWPGDKIELPAIGLHVSLKEVPATAIKYDKTSTCQYIDADHLTYPLSLRRWQSGDRFQPLGLNGSKTISNYLTDRKYSREKRNKICVLMEKTHIAALPGEQIDERYRISPETRVALQVEARWNDDTGNIGN